MNVLAAAKFNARLAILSSFFEDLTFILPIWLLYSLDILHLTPTVAVGIFMSIWITSALLEVPTGALADRLGRKKVFIIGQFLLCLYPLAYALELPVGVLVAICLVSAVGSALRSGALLPLVHGSFALAGLSEKAYHNFLSTRQVTTFVARALSGVTGAALYAVNPKWPFLAMFVAVAANFLLGFFIRDSQVIEKTAVTTNWQHIKQTLMIMKQSSLLIAIFTAYITLNLTFEVIWTGYQVFYAADGLSATVIGLLFSIIAVCSAIGAYLIRFIHRKVHPLQFMSSMRGLAIILTAFLIWQPNEYLRILAIFPSAFVSGMTIFVLNATIQKNIANKYHSTALSLVSLAQYGTYAVGSLLFGVLTQIYGLAQTRTILLNTTVLICIGTFVWSRGRQSIHVSA